ncbi:hypothetical protein [Dokdonia sp. R86516]|uniref:hypothetical protein n=1 Tax=Dokdonia sp. R86516 TaxID=3093856 RepID=UPI0037CB18C1
MKLSNQEYIKQLDFLEQKNGLYDIVLGGVPLWRLIRFRYRVSFLKNVNGFTNKTTKNNIDIIHIIKWSIVSVYELCKVLLSRKQDTTLFLPFPRLEFESGIYYDKFTDPVIAKTTFPGDTVIFQNSLGGRYSNPRANGDKTIKIDCLSYISKVVSLLLLPFVLFFYKSRLSLLKKRLATIYSIEKFFSLKLALIIGTFVINRLLYKILFKILDVKSVFLVSRTVFIPQIVAAHDLKIPIYELQHGATPAESALYTGPYNAKVDPDLFLCFGRMWVGEQFGLPLPQVKNIGWALKDYQNLYKGVVQNHKRLLFISYPAITSKIISVLKTLSLNNTYYTYVLRLHPQEVLSDSQQKDLKALPNVKVELYTKNVQESILESKIVFGDKSTVLYEALSLGKTVRQINFGELKRDHSSLEESLFKPLDTLDDFFISLEDKDEKITHSTDIYSNFDSSLMNDILNI